MIMNKKILLVNPWIYDFAAYDFWSKPLGLLQIGGVLQDAGFDLQLLDCLDRNHPAFSDSNFKIPHGKSNGTGKFYRDSIDKPDVLSHIDRKYCRYGLPIELVKHELQNHIEKPDLICLTSIMTYWYPAVKDIYALLKSYFPDTPIILGGIYATLAPEHAREHIAPDFLFTGSDISLFIKLLNHILGTDVKHTLNCLSDLPYPVYGLYPQLEAIAILTSTGCPYRCSFCASHLLNPKFDKRKPEEVFREIQYWVNVKQISHVAFYDDALLYKSTSYIEPLLLQLVQANIRIRLHTPNGIPPRFVNSNFASLFAEAGGQTVRLSFESVDPDRQNKMSKVNNRDLEQAISNLVKAGVNPDDIGVYVLMGLPDQTLNEVLASVNFVKSLGVKINIASFSPIPGTIDWKRAVENNLWSNDTDLLLSNTSIFPLWSNKYGYQAVEEFMRQLKQDYISNRNDTLSTNIYEETITQ